MVKNVALILAGGRGVRAGGEMPKQYRKVNGLPLLRFTLETFVNHPAIDSVRAVIHPDDEALYAEAADGLALESPVLGGETSQDSGLNGLRSLADTGPAKVLIHDGARPFVSAETISRVIEALDDDVAVLAAVEVTDTIKKQRDDGTVEMTVARDGLWRAQTPQGFRFEEILAAHEKCAGEDLTDDAAVAEAGGHKVRLVAGNEENFKVTQAEDFARAEAQLNGKSSGITVDFSGIRTGTGFDVHRFGPGDKVIVCGVEIPHSHALLGHSDADVGMHAVTDAILGAIADGDIGSHFPPSDPKWKGAASEIFLVKAAELVRDRGGEINHVDLTIICEQPKMGPHRDAMRAKLAEILAMPTDRVGVKATTTEQLGFTGRGEGIAAQATATVWLK